MKGKEEKEKINNLYILESLRFCRHCCCACDCGRRRRRRHKLPCSQVLSSSRMQRFARSFPVVVAFGLCSRFGLCEAGNPEAKKITLSAGDWDEDWDHAEKGASEKNGKRRHVIVLCVSWLPVLRAW